MIKRNHSQDPIRAVVAILLTCLSPIGLSAASLTICSDVTTCPEASTYLPSNQSISPSGATYADQVPNTLDLAEWAREYTRSFMALLLPANSFAAVAQNDKIHGGTWVPDGAYAFGIETTWQKAHPEQKDLYPDYACMTSAGGVGSAPCIEAFAASQWGGGLSSVLRSREMSGYDLNDGDQTLSKELSSLRGVLKWYQANQSPGYATMMVGDLYRQSPGNAAVVDLMNKVLQYLRDSMTTEDMGAGRTFSYWTNIMILSAGGGDEDYGGYQNRHYIEVYAQANNALPLFEWYLLTGDPLAFDLGAKANDFVKNYHKRRIITPFAGSGAQTVGSGNVTVWVDVGPADKGIRVEIQKDGALLQSFSGPPYSFTWNTAAETPGAHVLKAVAYDPKGITPAVDLNVTIDPSSNGTQIPFMLDDDLRFWDNPDPSKYTADGPVAFVGALVGVDAAEAFTAEALARLKRGQPGDADVAHENITWAKLIYDFVKRRGSLRGVLGHFGGAGSLGEMIRLATHLAQLSKTYPNELGAQSDYWEDIERWTRNAAAEMRIDASIASAYIPNVASGDPRFDNIGSRSVGAFQSDGGHPFITPSFLFVDNNDGFWLQRGLYDAWSRSVELQADGMQVNLLMNRAARYADVYSDIPYRGAVRVRMRSDIGPITWLGIRIPTWALSGAVTVTENGSALTQGSDWQLSGAYAVIRPVKPNATYEIRFPQAIRKIPFRQLSSQNQFWLNSTFGGFLTAESPIDYLGTFIGDTLVDVDHRPSLQDKWGYNGIQRYQRQSLANQITGATFDIEPPSPVQVVRFVSGVSAAAGTPVISITTPASGAAVSGTVNFGVTASPAQSITKIEFLVDGQILATTTGSPYGPPTVVAWDTTASPNGNHALTAKAYPASGSAGQASPVSVSVANTLTADIGLKAFDGTQQIRIAVEPSGTLTSLLRLRGADGQIHGVLLVDPSDPSASKLRLSTSQGSKALRKL